MMLIARQFSLQTQCHLGESLQLLRTQLNWVIQLRPYWLHIYSSYSEVDAISFYTLKFAYYKLGAAVFISLLSLFQAVFLKTTTHNWIYLSKCWYLVVLGFACLSDLIELCHYTVATGRSPAVVSKSRPILTLFELNDGPAYDFKRSHSYDDCSSYNLKDFVSLLLPCLDLTDKK
jgi:hypothetical protein